MGQANTLRLMLNRTTVYNGMFELFNNGLMDGVALLLVVHESATFVVKSSVWGLPGHTHEIFNCRGVSPQNNWRTVVWLLAFWLGINPLQL
jgi:hypothetical protein